ncbi:hypothetical protein FsymDg_4136 [Candidatus Protofrankia datiscae]|uniref:Uncharacterized protein n=1 Tax=Candidatus Protofrankia datiscae TaxID=2716812 RepID=F8AWW3_9ACTN|nr:hypothetical protein FsymDg_4136 [Candidatus Protofrankia datiscae]
MSTAPKTRGSDGPIMGVRAGEDRDARRRDASILRRFEER